MINRGIRGKWLPAVDEEEELPAGGEAEPLLEHDGELQRGHLHRDQPLHLQPPSSIQASLYQLINHARVRSFEKGQSQDRS